MDLKLSGRTCLISGASSGIGAGIAKALANEGVLTVITARRTEQLEQLAVSISDSGGSRPLLQGNEVWEEAFALNFTAARLLTEALLPGMRKRHWGRVINISGSMEPHSSNAASPTEKQDRRSLKGIFRLVILGILRTWRMR